MAKVGLFVLLVIRLLPHSIWLSLSAKNDGQGTPPLKG